MNVVQHSIYMKRCIELANLGQGNVSPNPMVGAVIVYNNHIIGEGYHKKIGTPHAESNAINAVIDKSLLASSILYVNLEPCTHYGKTPPCTDLILKYKIPKVIIACTDTSKKINGKGIELLKQNGCEVIIGILQKEARWLNRRFFTFHEKQRPYIILKWAQSKDRFIDKIRNNHEKPVWFTDELCRMVVHKWRSEEDVILIGTNTAEKDNPQLNVRNWTGKNPIRAVIDNHLRLPDTLTIFDRNNYTIVFNSKKDEVLPNLEYIKIDFRNDIVHQICECFYKRNILSVMVEGGTQLLESFINKGLFDEIRVFTGPVQLQQGIKSPNIPVDLTLKKKIIGNSELIYYTTTNNINAANS